VEVRTAVSGSGISRSFVAVMAVVATMGLGVTAGVVAKNLSAPAAVPAHVVQGQGGSLQLSGHRGGVQSINENLQPAYQQVDTRGVKAAPAAVGPDDRPTTTHPALSGNLQADTRGIIPAEAFAPVAQFAPNSFLGPDAQERNAKLAAALAPDPTLGYDISSFTQGAPNTQLAPNSFVGPDAQERNSQLAASMRVLKAHGYI
jgi:hypothetical protein